ncbi:hypothetical protein HK100_012386 [Physocladia obscura]|uniref:Uncharacterized protein n=1 Tax=Physocladia obscura TaxID=109957 RepID=A0AAD5T2M1_9FUNG|nr:hypothetical protein HK100_012386 [Physocladia obscura]
MCFIAFAYASIFSRVAKLNRDVKSALAVDAYGCGRGACGAGGAGGDVGGGKAEEFGGTASHATETAKGLRVERDPLWNIRRISFVTTQPEITVLQIEAPAPAAQDRLDKQQIDLLNQIFLYEITGQQFASRTFDFVGIFFAQLNESANALIVLRFDKNIQANIKKLFTSANSTFTFQNDE